MCARSFYILLTENLELKYLEDVEWLKINGENELVI